jgi:hypothetical protein
VETHKYAPREIASGSLARATKLPEGVDTDNI